MAQLPTVLVIVSGRSFRGLVDSGCSQTIVSPAIQRLAQKIAFTNAVVTTMNGAKVNCDKECVVQMAVQNQPVTVTCLAANILRGVDVLLGMDVIRHLGGVQISSSGEPHFNVQTKCAVSTVSKDLVIEDKDFVAKYSHGRWQVGWKWKDENENPQFCKRIAQYTVTHDLQPAFDEEVQQWIDNGWLKPYTGPYSCLIPLMAVMQSNKHKIRPVLDYRELNEYVSSHTGESVVCGEKLRSWRRLGDNVKLLDLRKAYLQVHVFENLWKYQVTKFKGKTYCLTRLGFGLNVAPKIMTAIVNAVLSSDPQTAAGTDSYIDDIIVNENIVSCEQVQTLLLRFGLESKPPELLNGGRVLGLRVSDKDGVLWWRRDNQMEKLKPRMTKRDVFSLCGQLVGHFPVASWLRPACSFIKRSLNEINWNDQADEKRIAMLTEVMEMIQAKDPVQGKWTVCKADGTLWCDASSLALGIALEIDGNIVEDGCWLRKKNDASHINLAELDAVVKGLNLATQWNISELKIATDSATVYTWINSIIHKDKRIKIHGMSQVLVRRRLGLIEDILKECNIKAHIVKVTSDQNKADRLTRVPRKWLSQVSDGFACVVIDENEATPQQQLAEIHGQTHFGVDRTLYVAEKCFPDIAIKKDDVKSVIQKCHQCQSIDPAPIQWEKGGLEVQETWYRLAADVTHYRREQFLTLIDCGPSRFAIWKPIKNESCREIGKKFEEIFQERGPPVELLLDNARVFRSDKLKKLCSKWGVILTFRCVNRPSGNGIIERNHRTIKRMAARTKGRVADMVFWYNFAPKEELDARSVPCSAIFTYKWRCPGMPSPCQVEGETLCGSFPIGSEVFVKPPRPRCTTQWESGKVTGHGRDNRVVEVDGLPRHIADVRQVPPDENASPDDESATCNEEIVPSEAYSRPIRFRRRPTWQDDFVCD
jgi:ribonuclease HI